MKIIKLSALFIALLFSPIALIYSSQENFPIRGTVNLKQRDSNWELEITEEHENGVPKIVVFYEPSLNNGEAIPVKKMEYDCTGILSSETDLIFLEDIHPLAKKTGHRIHPHGLKIRFFPSGIINNIFVYEKGILHGLAREYDSNGTLRSNIFYENGLKQGLVEFFYEEGNLKERAHYVLDQLFGKKTEWFKEGTLKAEYHYVNGILSDNKDVAASLEYFPNKKIKGEKHYLNGLAHGAHRKYDDDGSLRHNVVYFFGNKNGLESYYFKDQKIEGEGRYIKGTPVGRHYRKHSNGVDALVAFYDPFGNLKDPIVEYDRAGNRRAEYRLVDGECGGEFLEWCPGEILKNEYHYEFEDFENDQNNYFPTGDIKIKVT